MAASEPVIRATALMGLRDALASAPRPVDLDRLLQYVGIGTELHRESEIELRRYSQLLELASDQSGIACLGIALAESYPREATSMIGYLIVNAPDMRAAVRSISRYVRLQVEAVTLDLEERDGVARISWTYDAAFHGPRRQLTEFMMALFVERLKQSFGNHWLPISAEFEHRAPSSLADYHRKFGRNLKFEAAGNTLSFRSDILARTNRSGSPTLFAILRKSAERELEEYARSTDIVARVSEKIIAALPEQVIDLAAAADALAITSRQLQARLKDKGTTFETVSGQVRQRLASRYLSDNDMSLTNIALMLGFSELSSFTRACRQWFGMPPSQYRDELRKGGSKGSGGTPAGASP